MMTGIVLHVVTVGICLYMHATHTKAYTRQHSKAYTKTTHQKRKEKCMPLGVTYNNCN